MDQGRGVAVLTRLTDSGIVTDHDLIVVQSNDHHPPAEIARVQQNGVSISPGAYEHRIAWAYGGHKVTEALLAASGTPVPGGKLGAWAMGAQSSTQSDSRFISGAGVYTYIASFSRLHGDTYLSTAIFGSSIYLRDIWLDGDETVLEFYNAAAVNRTLRFWGTVTTK